jgi:predicted dehydrogenase
VIRQTERVRFALLGTGYWAAEVHGPALAAHPDAELVGVWGRSPGKAARLAERFGVRAYDDLDALIADVDAVSIALPPDVQAQLAARAARAGRHLLLDKPLALTTEAADAVVDIVERQELCSIIFFTNRFYENVLAFLRDAAAVGGWHAARVTMFSSIFQPGSPYGGSIWRRDRGGLWDIGPHALSVIVPVLGSVTDVAALTGPHDTVHVVLRHFGGATSTMALTLNAPPAATTREFVFYGTQGIATVPRGDTDSLTAFGRAIGELVAAVKAGSTAHPCDVRFGREVVSVLAAADEACRTGRTVSI